MCIIPTYLDKADKAITVTGKITENKCFVLTDGYPWYLEQYKKFKSSGGERDLLIGALIFISYAELIFIVFLCKIT